MQFAPCERKSNEQQPVHLSPAEDYASVLSRVEIARAGARAITKARFCCVRAEYISTLMMCNYIRFSARNVERLITGRRFVPALTKNRAQRQNFAVTCLGSTERSFFLSLSAGFSTSIYLPPSVPFSRAGPDSRKDLILFGGVLRRDRLPDEKSMRSTSG